MIDPHFTPEPAPRFVVLLRIGTWIAGTMFKPRSTTNVEEATYFTSYYSARYAIRQARLTQPYPDAKIRPI